MFNGKGYNLSDIAAVTGNRGGDGMFGDNGGLFCCSYSQVGAVDLAASVEAALSQFPQPRLM